MDRLLSQKLLNKECAIVSLVVSLVTGHNSLGYHNFLCGDGNDPLCRFCRQENETFFHLFTICPAFISYRVEIRKCYIDQTAGDWTVEQVVRFAEIDSIKSILNEWQGSLMHSNSS